MIFATIALADGFLMFMFGVGLFHLVKAWRNVEKPDVPRPATRRDLFRKIRLWRK